MYGLCGGSLLAGGRARLGHQQEQVGSLLLAGPVWLQTAVVVLEVESVLLMFSANQHMSIISSFALATCNWNMLSDLGHGHLH
jgi:hypothetical protein